MLTLYRVTASKLSAPSKEAVETLLVVVHVIVVVDVSQEMDVPNAHWYKRIQRSDKQTDH